MTRLVILAALSIGVALLSTAPLPAEAGLLLVVNSTADTSDSAPGDGVCDGGGICTLRAAIEEANATSGADTILFGIDCIDFVGDTTCGPDVVFTIAPASPLPAVTDPATIIGPTPPEVIVLNGAGAGNADGLRLQDTRKSIIRGLVINGFSGAGIFIAGGNENAIEGNLIGTDEKGVEARPNTVGVRISDSIFNILGGNNPDQRNLISGNSGPGVEIAGANAGGNRVTGNYIGTNASADGDLGNGGAGVVITSPILRENGNIIGQSGAPERNVISGNGVDGVLISGGGANEVSGNFIGTDRTGALPIPNELSGVVIENSFFNHIGGADPSQRNVISGNHHDGVSILDGVSVSFIEGNYIGTDLTGMAAVPNDVGVFVAAADSTIIGGEQPWRGNVISGNSRVGVTLGFDSGTYIQGNFIGTTADGTTALPNGVGIENVGPGNPANAFIGGTTREAANVISGNSGFGIALFDASVITVQGNRIGTDVNGTAAVPNGQSGVLIERGEFNLIGGESPGAGNLISANQNSGVTIFASSNDKVQGNFIGTNYDGTAALGNGFAGVEMEDVGDVIGGHLVGGSTPAARNLISGNEFGVLISRASGNAIQGNYIGTDVTGDSPLGNTASGVLIENAKTNVIGGEIDGTGNLISGNQDNGVTVFDSSDNAVQGNFIGANRSGTVVVGGQRVGVEMSASGSFVGNNLVGGRSPEARNLISGNQIGVLAEDSGGNAIEGNYIGTDVSGSREVPNFTGVLLGSAGNTVGGTAPGTRNVISGNDGDGVAIDGFIGEASSNAVQGNYIGTDASGTLAVPNSTGVSIAAASNDTVGGVEAGAPNVIAFSGGNGVDVQGPGATGNTIRANSIYSSVSMGIETQNGGNSELPPPVIKSAGSASGTACGGCTVDVYSDDEDEGRVYHGSTTADASGNWSFADAVTGPNVTATATDSAGNTSEFSAPFALGRHDAAALKISVPEEGQAMSPIQVRVQNLSERTAVVGVYADVIPPGGTSNPYGCTSGRAIGWSVTLTPGQKTTVSSADITFGCADAAGARGKKYTVVAVADVRGDDLAACGEGQLQSMTCYSALADDDANSANNRISRTCCKVH